SARGMLQAFEAAIPVIELAKPEGQIAMDLLEVRRAGSHTPRPFPVTVTTPEIGMDIPETVPVAPPMGHLFNPAETRLQMAAAGGAPARFATEVKPPVAGESVTADMQMVEL